MKWNVKIGLNNLRNTKFNDILTSKTLMYKISTKETISNLDKQSETIVLSQAYLDGINEFIKQGPTPIEFYLTGIDKEPFTIEDVYNAVGYMAFSFAMAHKTDTLFPTDALPSVGKSVHL